MKKSYFLIVSILLLSCHNQKKQNVYILKIYKDSLNLTTNKYEPKIDTQIIKSKNDTIGYKHGFVSYYTDAFFQRNTHFKYVRTKSFKVLNKEGVDVKSILSPKVMDSIEQKIINRVKKDSSEAANSK